MKESHGWKDENIDGIKIEKNPWALLFLLSSQYLGCLSTVISTTLSTMHYIFR